MPVIGDCQNMVRKERAYILLRNAWPYTIVSKMTSHQSSSHLRHTCESVTYFSRLRGRRLSGVPCTKDLVRTSAFHASMGCVSYIYAANSVTSSSPSAGHPCADQTAQTMVRAWVSLQGQGMSRAAQHLYVRPLSSADCGTCICM